MRGKRFIGVKLSKAFGITPACAGKTSHLALETKRYRDHPRVCGENTSEMAYFRG